MMYSTRLYWVENLRAFPPGTLRLLKQDFRKQTLVNFNDKRLAASDISVILRDGSQDRVRVICPESSTLVCGVQQQDAEAFDYCALSTQVYVRSSILGALKGAKEAQRDFLILIEDFMRQPDISRSVQQALVDAKVKLDLAISPGIWVKPSNQCPAPQIERSNQKILYPRLRLSPFQEKSHQTPFWRPRRRML